MDILSPFPYKATVGIDWADRKHDVFVRFAKGDSYRRKIDSRPEAIQEWLLELRSACAEGKIAIALEQRRGALFYQLCTHLNSVELSIAVAFAPIPEVRKYGGPSNPVIA